MQDPEDWTPEPAEKPQASPLALELSTLTEEKWEAVEPDGHSSPQNGELPTDKTVVSVRAAQGLYIAALRRSGSVLIAKRVSGCHGSRLNAWRADDGFREAEKQAVSDTGELCKARAVNLAVEGIDEPMVSGGTIIGYRKKYSEKLLIELLRGLCPETFGTKKAPGTVNNTVIMSDPATIADAVRRLSPTRRKGEVIEVKAVEVDNGHNAKQPLDTQTEHQR